jgi:DNA polymerase
MLSLDFETACVLSLDDCGSAAYARHSSFTVTTMAWAFNDGPVSSQELPSALPAEVAAHIASGGIVRAWNLAFESDVLKNFFGVELDESQIDDTQARAMYYGLPASLGDAGDALSLEILKDKRARQLMLQMARPRVDKNGVTRWWHDEDKEKLKALTAYCVADVSAERAIAKALPELPEAEKEIYRLTHRINNRGIKFEMPLVALMRDVAGDALKEINDRACVISDGFITSPGTQHLRMPKFFNGHGIKSFDKKALPILLERDDFTLAQKEMLELRSLAAKSSTAKLETIDAYADAEGLVRGTLKYYGAHSGRYSSKGPQIQNLPRGSLKSPTDAINDILSGMDAHGLSLFYGAPMEVLSSCIRGTIIPRPGNVLIGFDFAQIEARITAYAAGQNDLVEVFKRNEDIYVYTANSVGLPDRQSGKALALGLGFGLGHKKFVDFAKTYGVELTIERSQELVRAWRTKNNRIVSTWYALDDAARNAVQIAASSGTQSSTVRVNDFLTFAVRPAKNNGAPVLMLRLPGGRVLFYRDIGFERKEKFGEMRDVLVCSGVDQQTKKYKLRGVELYGGKFFENAVQGWAAQLMINAMIEIENRKLGAITMSIHDEIVCEVQEDLARQRFEEIGSLMRVTPDWCEGLPLEAEGDIMRRFKK